MLAAPGVEPVRAFLSCPTCTPPGPLAGGQASPRSELPLPERGPYPVTVRPECGESHSQRNPEPGSEDQAQECKQLDRATLGNIERKLFVVP